MTSHASEPTTVALLSPCGWGNLGDAAIIAAAVDEIRVRLPHVRIVAFTLNPLDTEERHGISAFALDSSSLAGSGSRRLVQRLLGAVRRVSGRLSGIVSQMLNMVALPWREGMHWWNSYRVVRKCRLVIVCGGGQLDELWGGPWGHPYAMFKFALLSRLAGARLIILSSGSARLKSRLGQWFVKRALRAADYRSFREHFAVELARKLGAPEPNHWCPDLAFALPAARTSLRRKGDHRAIAVSPIAWLDPRSWPQKDARRFETYLEQVTDFLKTLIARNDRVVLFATAAADHRVIADLLGRLRAQSIPHLDELLEVSSARSVPDLLELLYGVDVVVASRLHGVLLSYVCGIPVAVVSYDPKVDHLVDSFGQQGARLAIDDLHAGDLLGNLDRLRANREAISRQLEIKTAECRQLVAEQYDRVLGLAVDRHTGVPREDVGPVNGWDRLIDEPMPAAPGISGARSVLIPAASLAPRIQDKTANSPRETSVNEEPEAL